MAYQTGTATNQADLLDKLRAFLLANGWTIEAWRFQIGQPTWRWLAFSKSGFFFNFMEIKTAALSSAATAEHIAVRYADSYNSAVEYSAQLPNHGETYAADTVGPYSSYHFFEGVGRSGPYVYCAVELGIGDFRHFGAGVLDKVGTYTGGQFVFGTRHDMRNGWINTAVTSRGHSYPFDDSLWTGVSGGIPRSVTMVRCDDSLGGNTTDARYDAAAGQLARCGGFRGTNDAAQNNGTGSPSAAFWAAGPLASIAVSPLIRVPYFVERGVADTFALIGEPPAFRHFDIRYNNPGDEITLGAEVWKVFPIIRKGTPTSTLAASQNYAIAYRKS